jgi:hypothetical protein
MESSKGRSINAKDNNIIMHVAANIAKLPELLLRALIQ